MVHYGEELLGHLPVEAGVRLGDLRRCHGRRPAAARFVALPFPPLSPPVMAAVLGEKQMHTSRFTSAHEQQLSSIGHASTESSILYPGEERLLEILRPNHNLTLNHLHFTQVSSNTT